MRLSQLLESVNDDIAVLSKIADLVLSWLPSEIPADDSIRFERLPNSHTVVKSLLETVPESQHGLVLQLLTKTNYVFNNTKKHLNATEVGVHITDNATRTTAIVVNVSTFIGGYDSISKEELLSTKLNDQPFKSIKSILIHEMRHGQQYHNYGGHPSSDTYSYSTNPDEIDAAWLHHLSDYSVNDYNTAIDYVRSVMSSFDLYKKLTNKQRKHYLKKTAAYWYEHHNPNVDKVSPTDKLRDTTEKQINTLIDEVNDSMTISGINDLRTYDGYPQDASNFLIPYENFVTATRNTLTLVKEYNDKMIAYVYGFLSMLHDRLGINIDIAKRILHKKYSISLEQAIELIRKEGFGKFDGDYFIKVMGKSL